ncbi:MAG: sporulation integral membrane protein YlbJ [Firmicutes bacterium]|nr:sporulation integral membrane protein YlbJ [Bacillota bacterium]
MITVAMVIYPEVAFQSAVRGLLLWWEVVFPALLPFFIASQVLMGLGVVHFMGVLLEPLMRPLFRVPGTGSFVMAMGLASGYPLGAILTSKLREDKLCGRLEAERLLSFTNTADPLFMFGAVAVGMFGMAQVGVPIAIGHYTSSLALGFLMRFHGRGQMETGLRSSDHSRENLLGRAFRELYSARKRDGRPLGHLLGDAVRQSMNTLLLIGGFIILFSVMIKIATAVGLIELGRLGLAGLLSLINVDPDLAPSFISGIFEITIGSDIASKADAVLAQRLLAAGAIIAWSGLSVHGQVAAIIHKTDIRIKPYIIARFIHAVLAGIATYLAAVMLPPPPGTLPVLAPLGALGVDAVTSMGSWGGRLAASSSRAVLVPAFLAVLGILWQLGRGGRLLVVRIRR